jgi:hypothetical protein
MSKTPEELADNLFDAIKGYVARSLESFSKRIDDLSEKLSALELKPGPQGDKGEKGDSIKGDPGGKGDPGDSIHPDTIARMVRNEVDKAAALFPKAKDGLPGRDAADIQPLAAIDEAKSYPRGTWAKHAGGLWLARASATEGLAGWDCVVEGIAMMTVEQVSERKFTFKFAFSTGRIEIKEVTIPSMIQRGVWKQGEYERGDVVTWGGQIYHCDAALTTAKPLTPEAGSDWKLCVQRGRDGKDGKDGARGAQGPQGLSKSG